MGVFAFSTSVLIVNWVYLLGGKIMYFPSRGKVGEIMGKIGINQEQKDKFL
jgi:hypothetical protein